MPILHIKALPQTDKTKIDSALKKATLAIAEAYDCEPRQVWATWEEIQPGWYLEGSDSQSIQPKNSHPPIATLTCFEGASDEKIEKVLTATAISLSTALDLRDNIFVTYNEAKSGQVIAGDGIVRKK